MIRIDHLTDYKPAVLASMAKARGLKITRTKHSQTCLRCCGRGVYPSAFHGACFRCGGTGTDPQPEVRRHVEDNEAGQAFATELKEAYAALCAERQAEYQRIEEANAERREREQAERAAAEQARKAAHAERLEAELGDVVSALNNSPKSFANGLGQSLMDGEEIRGRGIQLAAELAAKQILGAARMSAKVAALADTIVERIHTFQKGA